MAAESNQATNSLATYRQQIQLLRHVTSQGTVTLSATARLARVVHDFLQQPVVVVIIIEKDMGVDLFVPFPIRLLLLVAVALSVRLVGSMIPHRAAVACGGTGGGSAGHDDDGQRKAERSL